MVYVRKQFCFQPGKEISSKNYHTKDFPLSVDNLHGNFILRQLGISESGGNGI
jgi:hypothetical protein